MTLGDSLTGSPAGSTDSTKVELARVKLLQELASLARGRAGAVGITWYRGSAKLTATLSASGSLVFDVDADFPAEYEWRVRRSLNSAIRLLYNEADTPPSGQWPSPKP